MFDYVILIQTLQEAQETALRDAGGPAGGTVRDREFPQLRPLAGPFPAAAHGAAPVSPALPYQWYDTPNIHSLAIKDFRVFVADLGGHEHVVLCRDLRGADRPNGRARLFAGGQTLQLPSTGECRRTAGRALCGYNGTAGSVAT